MNSETSALIYDTEYMAFFRLLVHLDLPSDLRNQWLERYKQDPELCRAYFYKSDNIKQHQQCLIL